MATSLLRTEILLALADAAERNQPLAEAVLAVENLPLPEMLHSGKAFTIGLSPCQKIARMIRQGESLADALKGLRLPQYAATAIRETELTGTLPQLLRALTRPSAPPPALPTPSTASLFTIILLTSLSFSPRIARNLRYFAPAPPSGGEWMDIQLNTTMTACVFFLLLAICSLLTPHRSSLLAWLPGLRSLASLDRRAKLMRVLAVAHASGHPLPQALSWASMTLSSRTLRKRLSCVQKAISTGHPLHQAWKEAKLGGPVEQWIVDSSQYAKDPVRLFTAASQHLESDAQYLRARLLRLIGPVLTIIAAIGVTLFACAVIEILTAYQQLSFQLVADYSRNPHPPVGI